MGNNSKCNENINTIRNQDNDKNAPQSSCKRIFTKVANINQKGNKNDSGKKNITKSKQNEKRNFPAVKLNIFQIPTQINNIWINNKYGQ